MIQTPALLLPLRLIDTANINNSFDGNFAISQLRYWQSKECYSQKFELSDTLFLQIISNLPLSDLKIFNTQGLLIDSVQWEENSLLLPAYPDYRIYEINYPIANLQEGKYIIQQDNYEAEPIEVAQSWDNTVLLSYKHSENDYSVVFGTNVEFQFRVEGWIGNYKPKNERDVYNDQTRNLTQLNSIAYRQFTLYIGYQQGLPDWVMDKVNMISQCDQLSIDGVAYQPIGDAEFETENNPENNFTGGSIDIEPKFNNFIKYITEGEPSNLTFQPVQNVTKYLNQGANFNVAGLFKFNSLLEAIAVYRVSATPITLSLGITPGGNEIGDITLNDFENTLQLNYLFDTARTVYISGLTGGSDISMFLIWKQLDVAPIPINPPENEATETGKGAIMQWKEIEVGDFLATWDMVTGLGKANTKWTKWCILGSNGTLPDEVDSRDLYLRHIGYEQIETNYIQLNTVVGANQKIIPRSALPAEGLALITGDYNNTTNDIPTPTSSIAVGSNGGESMYRYQLRRSGAQPDRALSAKMGDGEQFSVEPKTLVTLFIIKLVD